MSRMKFDKQTRIAIVFTMSVCLSLLLLRVLVGFPKQLVLLLSLSFLVTSFLFWVSRRERAYHHLLLVQSVVLWALPLAILLYGTYTIDRAGRNWFLLTGYDVVLPEQLQGEVDESLSAFIQAHPQFTASPLDARSLIIKPGEHRFDETLVVPVNTRLVIEPGAVLSFGAGCSLISYGPVHAVGTEAEPIVFKASTSFLKWGCVGLVQAGKSVFRHVRFENARRAKVNGIDFFAGLSVIESDIEISSCEFIDMYGKDAVNIRYGAALVRDSIFRNAFKDGIDMDGGSGEISNNIFINCEDEGIDLSENFAVTVFGNVIQDQRGGRIEADNDIEEIRQANSFGFLQ